MKNNIFCIILLIAQWSCNNDKPLAEFDLSNINKISIHNRGYNETPNIGRNTEIKDSIKIYNLIRLFKNANQISDGVIASNNGYIKLILQKTDGENITISNFYSIRNGKIILLEDDEGISRFRNDEFFKEVELLLKK